MTHNRLHLLWSRDNWFQTVLSANFVAQDDGKRVYSFETDGIETPVAGGEPITPEECLRLLPPGRGILRESFRFLGPRPGIRWKAMWYTMPIALYEVRADEKP